MTEIRTRTLGTKLTEDAYQRALTAAGPKPVSEWLRDVVLDHLDRAPLEDAIMGELLALRVIVLNFLRTSLAGEPLTMEKAGEHVQAGDLNKQSRGRAALRRVM